MYHSWTWSLLLIAAPPNHSTSFTPPALRTSSSGRLCKILHCGMYYSWAWCLVKQEYSVPHEESRKLFFVHFASFLQNQMSYGHVLCTIMIPYLPWFHRVLWLLVMWWSRDTRSPYIPLCSRQLLVEFLHNRWELRPDNAAFKPLPRVPSVTCA